MSAAYNPSCLCTLKGPTFEHEPDCIRRAQSVIYQPADVAVEFRHRVARFIAPFRGREQYLREWAGQGRSTAWIAGQLETSECRAGRRLRRMGLRG